MSDPIENDIAREWLGAYLDGELNAERRAWVESHLAGCAGCRQELEDLRRLSRFLQADALPVSGRSADEFAAQVLARLPEMKQPAWHRGLRLGLRYAPLGIFAAWAFFQAVSWISAAVLIALNVIPGLPSNAVTAGLEGLSSGWLSQSLSGLLPLAPLAGLDRLAPLAGLDRLAPLAGLDRLAPLASLATLGDLSWLPWFSPIALFGMGITAVLAALFLAWLAGAWSQRRQKMLNTES